MMIASDHRAHMSTRNAVFAGTRPCAHGEKLLMMILQGRRVASPRRTWGGFPVSGSGRGKWNREDNSMGNDVMTPEVPESGLRRQAIYYYLVLFLWPAYLLFLPPIFEHGGWFVIPYLIFPGLYVFTWLGYLMHESWHKYVPGINHRFFYNAFALMILSDPQLYHMTHGWHHSKVHTYEDAEFHPAGEIKPGGLRIIYNVLEIVLGIAFLVAVASRAIPRDSRFKGRYKTWKLLVSFLTWAVFFGGMGALTHLLFGVRVFHIVLSYLLIFWAGSTILHQSQLVEHGNLIVDGTFERRNSRTRNLPPSGILEKIFLFMTHNDSREHVLHHTMTRIHSRPFPGVLPLPEKAVRIDLKGHCGNLWRMFMGKTDHIADERA
jgi:hypothetical protein